MRPRLIAALLCAIGASVALAFPSHAALAPGTIWAVKVEGSAWLEGAARTRLTEGARIAPGSTIVTEANGNVVLLFENGSTVNIRPGSRFSIKEFLCKPFEPSKIEWRSLRSEPGESSRTKVQVDDGSIIANVRKLRRQSTYEITTPLGTAGIRGTTVYAEVDRRNTESPVSFGVADGSVVFTLNSGQSRTIDGGGAVAVSPQGQFAPPPASAQQMLTTARQVGQAMTQSAPPATPAAEPAAANPAGPAEGTGASAAAGAPVALASEGTITVIKDGAQSDGADNLNVPLAPGTIITSGENSTFTIEIAPGLVVQLQPNTQITVGQVTPDKAINENGDAIPETAVTLAVGSLLVSATPEALAAMSFVVETARGNVNSATAGSMVVTSTGADPGTATVTVAAVSGSKLAVSTEGEQLPVAEGLVVVLRPDGIEYGGISDFPDLLSVADVSEPVALPPAAPPPPPPPAPSPPPQPTPTPAPTPTPGPVSP